MEEVKNRIWDIVPFTDHKNKSTLFLEEGDIGVTGISVTERIGTRACTFGAAQHFASLKDALGARLVSGSYDAAVLMLDGAHAATVKSVVSIERENAEEPITEGELDAMLFRALWSFLNRVRPLSASKLGVSELDLVVANIAVCGVRIREHKVFNPLDFKGGELVIEFRGTFVPRAMVVPIGQISAHVKEPIIAVERGAIIAEVMHEDAVYVDIGESNADVYIACGSEINHIGRCEWGVKNVTEKIGIYFGVSRAIVGDVLKRYTKNQISEKVRSAVSGIARKETAVLRECVEEIMKKNVKRGKRLPVRFSIRGSEYSPELIESAHMHEIKIREEATSGAGMSRGQKTAHAALTEAQEEVAALVRYPYVDPQYAFLNQLLHRRVKWLVPHE